MSLLSVPSPYAYTLLVAASTGPLLVFQQINSGRARSAAKIPYPWQVPTAEEYKTDAGKKFFAAQRAHGNTLEGLTIFLFSLLFSGIKFPVLAPSLGALWVVNRVIYTIGYSISPKARMFGVTGQIGFMGLIITSMISAVALLP